MMRVIVHLGCGTKSNRAMGEARRHPSSSPRAAIESLSPVAQMSCAPCGALQSCRRCENDKRGKRGAITMGEAALYLVVSSSPC